MGIADSDLWERVRRNYGWHSVDDSYSKRSVRRPFSTRHDRPPLTALRAAASGNEPQFACRPALWS
jgi:hypothetical protein